MKTLSAILLLLLLPVFGWAQAPIYRQFFTTNPAPVVDVVAGSNATVVASTPAVNIRRFTVSSTAVGLSNIVDAGYVAAARNLDVATNLTTLVTSYSNTPVASLGTPSAGQFPIRYASDAITSRGTGDFVRWDGANWRTMENVVVADNYTNYLLNVYGAFVNVSGAAAYSYNWECHQNSLIPEFLNSTSAGTGIATVASVTSASAWGFGLGSRGTSSGNGYFALFGTRHNNVTCKGLYVGDVVYLQSLPTAATVFAVAIGINNAQNIVWPTSGAFFACDTHQLFISAGMLSGTPTATWTNNWLAVTANLSTYTIYDTGLAVSTTATAPNRLFVEMFYGGNAIFYTNGVAMLTNSVNVPTTEIVQIPGIFWTNSTAGAQYFLSTAKLGSGVVRTPPTLP